MLLCLVPSRLTYFSHLISLDEQLPDTRYTNVVECRMIVFLDIFDVVSVCVALIFIRHISAQVWIRIVHHTRRHSIGNVVDVSHRGLKSLVALVSDSDERFFVPY
jgi:hypothetical protein